MRRSRLVFFPLAALALALPASISASKAAAPSGPSGADTVKVEGTYVKTASGAKLTLKNTGTQTIIFDRVAAPGNKPISSGTQNGQACRQLTAPLAGQLGCGPFQWTAGQTVVMDVVVPGGVPFRLAGRQAVDFELFVLAEGAADDVGPTGIPPAAPPPCLCEKTDTKITRTALNFTDSHRFHMQFVWTMTCTGGEGTCKGEIDIEPPAGFTVTTPKKLTISCLGTCAKPSSQPLFIGGKFPKSARTLKQRRSEKFVFLFHKFCLDANGKRGAEQKPVGKMWVKYNKRGIPDQKKSDFNGNGIADGKEKK